jgi:hypothetical protein
LINEYLNNLGINTDCSMIDVMEQLANKWNTFSEEEQKNISNSMTNNYLIV